VAIFPGVAIPEVPVQVGLEHPGMRRSNLIAQLFGVLDDEATVGFQPDAEECSGIIRLRKGFSGKNAEDY